MAAMASVQRWKMVLFLVALVALIVVVTAAVSLESKHESREKELQHSVSGRLEAADRRKDRDREWWEEEEERERRRPRRREEEEEERGKEREREKEEESRRKEKEKQREKKEREEEERGRHKHENKTLPSTSPFVLARPKTFLKTDAGSIKVLPRKNKENLASLKKLGLGITTLEPKALLLPHYFDAPVVLYVLQGSARLGWVWESRYDSTELTDGDIYTLPGGAVHYILNTDSKMRLKIFAALDARNSLIPGHFQPFFVAGGRYPSTVLSGFSTDILTAAYKVEKDTVIDILSAQNRGAIISTTGTEFNKSSAVDLCRRLPLQPFSSWWSGWYVVSRILGAPWSRTTKPFNLLKKKPDFQNDNGWSSTADRKAFSNLKFADIGLFAVSLEAGSMLAPHWNPSATEISMVTKGTGYVHVAFPNGTKALEAEVTEGTVFVVPRYFPVTQVASLDGNFQFVGFSTSSQPSKPQFLAGANSVLNLLSKNAEFDVLEESYNASKDAVHDFLSPQKDPVILSGFEVSKPVVQSLFAYAK